MLIDTHIHLDDKRYEEDLQEVLLRAKDGGVTHFIIPGADPKTLSKAVEIAHKYENVYFAVGVHPYDVENFDIEFLKQYIQDSKCVAVGECGLDYFRLEGDVSQKEAVKQKQKEVFIAQINLAKEYKKPLIVHIRDASADAKTLLLEHNGCEVGGVLHCFNADEQLLSLAKCGFYFGIGGVVTFKNAKKLVQVLPKIPLEKLLIETDGPYLTPEPHRGKRNEPLYTLHVAKKMAEILDISQENIENLTTKNAKELFNIS
jgi:TatD DNase family protein